jgi:hypothetical protein
MMMETDPVPETLCLRTFNKTGNSEIEHFDPLDFVLVIFYSVTSQTSYESCFVLSSEQAVFRST